MFRDLVATVLRDSNVAARNRVRDKGNALFTLTVNVKIVRNVYK